MARGAGERASDEAAPGAASARVGRLLAPRSVALVGLPGDPGSPLARPLHALRRHGYAGRIYPVNPRHDRIGGLPCYPSLAALPEPPDAAWIAVPGARVLELVDECAARGTASAVVASSGFAESGPAGEARQAELAARARAGGVTLLGPNSIGFVNTWARAPLCFSAAVEAPALHPGDVAIVSQSGGLGGSLFNRLQDRRLGVGYLISTGNEADVGIEDCLEFLVDDPRTRVVVLVVEGLRDGPRFRRAAARALEADKPVIALRLGTTAAGAEVARSHTGALVGSARAWRAVAEQLGVIAAEDVAEVTDAAVWCTRARPTALRRVAIATSSGGAAVHLADLLTRAGFELPAVPPETASRLRTVLPAYASPTNPLDVTAGIPDAIFAAALAALGDAPGLDVVLLPLTMLIEAQASARLRALGHVAETIPAAVAVCWLGGSLTRASAALADELGLASFDGSAGMVRAMARVAAHRAARARWACRPPPAPVPAVAAPGAGVLPYLDACRLVEAAGIPLPRQALARDAAGAGAAAAALGYPVAAKVVGPGFLHKSDRAAVRLGLADAGAAAAALAALDALGAEGREGFLVQAMAVGTEVLVGVTRDPTFGALLTVGPGGVLTELAEGHGVVPLPATAEEVEALIRAQPALRRLQGHRDEPPADVPALVDVALRLGDLALGLGPRLREIDLNPVLVGPRGTGAVAVDVLAVLGAEA